MKKKIRLTESDLIKIINRVIKEQNVDITQGNLNTSSQPSTGRNIKYIWKDIQGDRLTNFLNWYPKGNDFLSINNFIKKTYGSSPLISKLGLENPKTGESALYQDFLNVVTLSLIEAAKNKMNGAHFIQTYNFANLPTNSPNYPIKSGSNFLKRFKESLGGGLWDEKKLKNFIGNVIDIQLNKINKS